MVSALSGSIRSVRAEEFSDIRTYAAVDVVRDIMLFGATPEEAKASIMTTVLGDGFCQSIRMVADELGLVDRPEIRVTHDDRGGDRPHRLPDGRDRARAGSRRSGSRGRRRSAASRSSAPS